MKTLIIIIGITIGIIIICAIVIAFPVIFGIFAIMVYLVAATYQEFGDDIYKFIMKWK